MLGNTFIDLFCGIGGFRVALEREGLECVFSSEINKNAKLAYKANFGDEPFGDITKIPVEDIPPHDVLCGGFPCQSFSSSGTRKGFDDERGQLFFDIVRIAEHHQPKIMLLENVNNILILENGAIIATIEQMLDDIGYRVHYDLLNASDYGIPQARKRVYIVCIRKDLPFTYSPPEPTYEKVYLQDVLLPSSMCQHRLDDLPYKYDLQWLHDDFLLEPELRTIRVAKWNNGKHQNTRIYSPKGHAVTLMGCGITGRYLIDGQFRFLHSIEAKRCQGFDDWHRVSPGGTGFRQIGNSVIPKMVQLVYQGIRPLTFEPESDTIHTPFITNSENTMSKPTGILETILENQTKIMATLEALGIAMDAAKTVQDGAASVAPEPTPEPEPKKKRGRPAKKKPEPEPEAPAEDKDWVQETTKLARRLVSEGVERAKIMKIIQDAGFQTIANADNEQAKSIHDQILAIGEENDGF